MKALKKIAAAMLAGALALITFSPAAFAAGENEANFAGAAGGQAWGYVGVKTYGDLNDLFGEVTKNLVPGDEKTVKVQLRNSSDAETIFYLKAERLTAADAAAVKDKSPEKYEALLADIKAVEAAFPDKQALDALLDHISIEVKYGDAALYTGTLGGAGAGALYSETGAALGALAPGHYGAITVSLAVSPDLGNDYANALCAVNWLFTATQADPEVPDVPGQEDNDPDGNDPDGNDPDDNDPGGGDPGETVIPENPTPLDDGELTDVEILDEATPLGELPGDTDLVVIADPEVPLGLPQTGGLLTYATPAALALVILLALYAATYIKDRRKGQAKAAAE